MLAFIASEKVAVGSTSVGLDWDAEFIQSQRLDCYADAAARLDTYPCTCTRREVLAAVQDSAGAPHGEEPVYPGTCRNGTVNPERPAATRWRVPDWNVCAHDAGTGETLCQHLVSEVGDFVLRRNDGAYAYHLAVVVDEVSVVVVSVVALTATHPPSGRPRAATSRLRSRSSAGRPPGCRPRAG